MGGQLQAPAALPPGETRYPFYMKLGTLQGRYGRARKASAQPGLDLRTFQPVASRYTDCAIPASFRLEWDTNFHSHLLMKQKANL